MNREHAEIFVQEAVNWVRLSIEALGVLVVIVGVFVALRLFLHSLLSREETRFTATRLVLARFLALALEFQLAADILSTAIAPSWDQVGKLGAIALIRTALSYFLSLEIKEENKAAELENRAGQS